MPQRITLFVGLIGSGKTELARAIDGEYLDFDDLWHSGEQVASGDPMRFVEYIAGLNHDHVVIDGWWTWTLQWWKTEGDQTLQRLKELSGASICLAFLPVTEAEAMANYLKKQSAGVYDGSITPLRNPEWYRKTIPARISYMNKKVTEWARSSATY